MGFLFILSTDQANKLVLAEVLKGLAASAATVCTLASSRGCIYSPLPDLKKPT